MQTYMTLERPSAEEDLRKSLESFVVDNAHLEKLESVVNQFNIFEADATDEELEIKIREQWEHFKESDLPLILKLVASV
jgi:hypothetical protein